MLAIPLLLPLDLSAIDGRARTTEMKGHSNGWIFRRGKG
jgi:hypothetical protein